MLIKALILPLSIILILFLIVSVVRGGRSGSVKTALLVTAPALLLLIVLSGMTLLFKLTFVLGIALAIALTLFLIKERISNRG